MSAQTQNGVEYTRRQYLVMVTTAANLRPAFRLITAFNDADALYQACTDYDPIILWSKEINK